MGKTHR